jgi:NAD(P)H-quinone oxidoreductase subunit K
MSEFTLKTGELQHDKQHLSENAILTTIDNLYNRIKIAELYHSETEPNCCFIKIASILSVQAEASHPADLLITANSVTRNFAPVLSRLYEQMPAPKFVMTLGACSPIDASLTPVDSVIPVDIYLAECPLRSQTILNAVSSLTALHYS